MISCAFAAFASLVSPFLGFLFSGLKRANHAKDFSGTLPGHGGFADRMDCITLMGFFSYFMLTQVTFPEEMRLDEAFNLSRQLTNVQQLAIIDELKKQLAPN